MTKIVQDNEIKGRQNAEQDNIRKKMKIKINRNKRGTNRKQDLLSSSQPDLLH